MKYNYNDEVALARNYQSGVDTKGRDKLIRNHYHQLAPALQKLKIYCEERHLKMYCGGYSDEDYMSELSLSLIKAVDMFIEKVSADASPNKNKNLAGIIARRLRGDTTTIIRAINKRQAETIDYCSENEKEIMGCGAIPCENVEEEVDVLCRNAALYAIIDSVYPCTDRNKKKREYIYHRYFRGETLAECGKAVGKSADGAKMLEAQILMRLRHPHNTRGLRGYL